SSGFAVVIALYIHAATHPDERGDDRRRAAEPPYPCLLVPPWGLLPGSLSADFYCRPLQVLRHRVPQFLRWSPFFRSSGFAWRGSRSRVAEAARQTASSRRRAEVRGFAQYASVPGFAPTRSQVPLPTPSQAPLRQTRDRPLACRARPARVVGPWYH